MRTSSSTIHAPPNDTAADRTIGVRDKMHGFSGFGRPTALVYTALYPALLRGVLVRRLGYISEGNVPSNVYTDDLGRRFFLSRGGF